MPTPNPNTAPVFQHLRTVRSAILDLHKTLLNSERTAYERLYGPVRSTGEFFQLVVDSEWFAWLRPLSQFIVKMDDVLMSKEPVPPEQATHLLEEARLMLQPNEFGTPLEKGYFQAIQRDPDIAQKYASVKQLLAQDVASPDP